MSLRCKACGSYDDELFGGLCTRCELLWDSDLLDPDPIRDDEILPVDVAFGRKHGCLVWE